MSQSRRTLCGVVVSAGRMMKAVKVRTAKQVYNSFLRKHFVTYKSHLVSDPNDSLRTGDSVRIMSGWRTSRHITHVVVEILAPWGPAIEERPPVLTEGELLKIKKEQREKRVERRRLRQEGRNDEEGKEGDGQSEGGQREVIHPSS